MVTRTRGLDLLNFGDFSNWCIRLFRASGRWRVSLRLTELMSSLRMMGFQKKSQTLRRVAWLRAVALLSWLRRVIEVRYL